MLLQYLPFLHEVMYPGRPDEEGFVELQKAFHFEGTEVFLHLDDDLEAEREREREGDKEREIERERGE